MANVVYNKLSSRKISTLDAPGRYTDGLGLMLLVDKSGCQRWVLRLSINGKRRDMGLGSAKDVSLKEARDRRSTIRAQIRAGDDPLMAVPKKRTVPSFEIYAVELHDSIKCQWKNSKHAGQWISTLRTYAFPTLGKIQVDEIDAQSIKETLKPIWTKKPETARRVKQRISRVLSAAIAEGYRTAPNPTADSTAALGSSRAKIKHFAAMPYANVPHFMHRLNTSSMSRSGRLAFQLLIMTATRTNEVLHARRCEIDLNNQIWTIPADRMKMGLAHQIPLSNTCLEILRDTFSQSSEFEYIFSNPATGRPLSNMVFTSALKRLKEPFTAHGFRSSFRDWAEEQTSFSFAVKEAALAHNSANKVEAAYRRTTLLNKRRALMEEWDSHCSKYT